MANSKGYILSQSLVDTIRNNNKKLSSLNSPAQGQVNNKQNHSRYFAKIVEKVSGTPSGCTYSAVQVIQDGSTFSTITGGLTWGNNSTDAGPLVDINSYNIKTDGSIDIDTVRINPNTIVEVWYYGDIDGDIIWYCDANYNVFAAESGYVVDSAMKIDSAHPETALTDSGWPNGTSTSGFIVTIQTGTVYDYTGDKVLYAFYRDFTYDGLGRLISISVERRQTVDTPEACS